MDNDVTFVAGTDRGGLHNFNDIKMLICYVLSSIAEPMPKNDLVQCIVEEGLANYFDTAEAVASLLNSSNIVENEIDGIDCCEITQRGVMFTSEIETAIPYSVREKALNAAVSLASHAKNAKETEVEIFKNTRGYTVTCTVKNKDLELFSVSLFVADRLQANFVKNNFIKNPDLVYGGSLALLSGNSEIISDMIERSKN